MADHGSFFEIGALWGTDQVVGFARFDGHPVGVIAGDSRHVNGGAMTADGCDKLTRHLDLCDLFHLPVLNLIDRRSCQRPRLRLCSHRRVFGLPTAKYDFR